MAERSLAETPTVEHGWIATDKQPPRFGTAIMSPLHETPDAWDQVLAIAQHAEALGLDSFWVPDHPLYYPDCWSTLAALAIHTRHIRLGSWVSCVAYRHPIQLARVAADVDRLSGGRLVLGVGIGDVAEEFAQLGIPFATISERQRRLEETVRIVSRLLRAEALTFAGEYYQIDAYALPLGPVQQPWVPLLIAGGGERVTLRQVAQYADLSNFGEHTYTGGARTLDDVRRKLAALDRHCAAIGRAPETVLRSHTTFPLVLAESRSAHTKKIPAALSPMQRESMVAVTVPEAITYYANLAAAGINYCIASIWGADVETLQLLAEQVLPAVRAL
jgi:alkanesulfonate monooxygenase SsuD/methylene tetrahydromethanopterin reductase-like flavin-dependent oxidoreductase (luciferase family)